ncbi:YebC/PmpR family DNA-binding transcriptional regulator [Candidatus Binatia bacterium]|jgi:YebC/PmpR family DNA-binding regulatory protein|nr:YebC/PmpR family DNA-binding transcriptional regulator [Candidatus Binatia bacterium]
MSGHSKWSTIKHKKAAKDAKRGKAFTKLIREITVATRMGNSGDPGFNPRLRTAILAAKAASMPNDNIERAIKKGLGEGGGAVYEDVMYEGYGPGGVAIMVRCLTDNRNRTVADVRGIFTRGGGSLGEAGCVGWMFQRRGVLIVAGDTLDEERVVEVTLDAGGDDVSGADGRWEVTTAPETFEAVRDALDKAGATIESAEVTMVSSNTVAVAGDDAQRLLKLLDMLEDHDDVQAVSVNADLDEEEVARLSA